MMASTLRGSSPILQMKMLVRKKVPHSNMVTRRAIKVANNGEKADHHFGGDFKRWCPFMLNGSNYLVLCLEKFVS